jgi:bis(5'-nucleosyl)-tetraphosphatase (symmetrical)
MSTYVIGDIQGCYHCLQILLEKINFCSQTDRLWLVGDLINRGPRSLEVLRFIKSLGTTAQIVLGNHDLGLLIHWRNKHIMKHTEFLDEILSAPDAEELLDWLRKQPLMYSDKEKRIILVHAGLYPFWSIETAQQHATLLSQALQSEQFSAVLSELAGDQPTRWKEQLPVIEQYRFICNAFTRMRYLSPDGTLHLKQKGPEPFINESLFAWFLHPALELQDYRLIFGHWAALQGKCTHPQIEAIDTGCVWGGELTALRIEDNLRFSVPCKTQTETAS